MRDRPAAAVTFLTCFAVAITWAFATPLFGVPDEISHMVRAAGAARGDIAGASTGPGGARSFRAPSILQPIGDPTGERGGICFAGLSQRSASCMTFSDDHTDRRIVSTAAPYPPFYYLLVGWPSRLSRGMAGLYGMRAASAALFSAMITLAVSSVGAGRRAGVATIGLAIALTPMVWFLSGAVNPSSIATSSAIAAWCGGYRLVHSDDSGLRRHAWRFGLPLCALLLLRRDSILWAGILVLGVAILARRDRIAPMIRSGHVLGWAAATAVCGAVAWSTGIRQGASFVNAEQGGSGSGALGALPQYFREMVGVLGWLDTVLPAGTYLLWYLLLGALVVPAIGLVTRRIALSIGYLVGAVSVAVVALGTQLFPYFQGRYALPAAVGVPILAGLGLAARPYAEKIPMRLVLFFLVSTAVVEVSAFIQQLRRYAFSGDPTWNLLGATQWSPPPAPVPLLVAANLAAIVSVAAWWFVRMREPLGDTVLGLASEPA